MYYTLTKRIAELEAQNEAQRLRIDYLYSLLSDSVKAPCS